MLLADQRGSSGFDCPSPHATLHPEAYLNWVDKIVRACPQLEALQLFSSESNTASFNHIMTGREAWGRGILLELGLDDEEDPNYILHLAGLHKISSLSNLRSLSTCVPEINQAALQVLGQMPHLETLFLYSNQHYRSQLQPPPINLPSGSFASLRNLRLDRTRPSFFQRILTPVPLFQKLAKASMKVDESRCDEEVLLTHFPSISALKCFGQHTPYLVDLTIDPGVERFVPLSWPIIDILGRLPLRRLNFCGIRFNPGTTIYKISDAGMQQDQPEIRWEHFLAAVLHLEELELKQQDVTLQELYTITTSLRRLRRLSLSTLQLNQIPGVPRTVTVAEPIVIDCRLRTFGARGITIYLAEVARYIYAFRPNARFERPIVPGYGRDQPVRTWVDQLNTVMCHLRISAAGIRSA
ncbi:hypothetical protein FRC08_018541 [Ceratobasidium sp. 394]|nr:hypothetical protein FRC08_018541 [Ceratobasidium sp. 394]